jgi:hypothetical protein
MKYYFRKITYFWFSTKIRHRPTRSIARKISGKSVPCKKSVYNQYPFFKNGIFAENYLKFTSQKWCPIGNKICRKICVLAMCRSWESRFFLFAYLKNMSKLSNHGTILSKFVDSMSPVCKDIFVRLCQSFHYVGTRHDPSAGVSIVAFRIDINIEN